MREDLEVTLTTKVHSKGTSFVLITIIMTITALLTTESLVPVTNSLFTLTHRRQTS